MTTTPNPIDVVIANEKGTSNNPSDKGGLTVDGISQVNNPDLFLNGHIPTTDEIRARYESKYVKGPGFDKVTFQPLQTQLIDYGVNSGPGIAIQKLQTILHIPVDGILGPQTLAIVNGKNAQDINNKLVAERIKMIGKIVHNNPSQLKFLNDWLARALEFLL